MNVISGSDVTFPLKTPEPGGGFMPLKRPLPFQFNFPATSNITNATLRSCGVKSIIRHLIFQ
jgi:hypothetical protein